MPHTRPAVTFHAAIGVVIVLVVQGGQTDVHKRQKTVFLWQTWTTGSSLAPTPQGDSEITEGVTLFIAVKVKPGLCNAKA